MLAGAKRSHIKIQIRTLRALAAWYRELAERTQNSSIWQARVKTAEELEMDVEAQELRAPKSAGSGMR
jgi:hypothetical protein